MGAALAWLMAGLAPARLAAQSWQLPASDPVGIARSGAGVAFGANLEAASLNPALLATLREDHSAFVAAGMELESSQGTLQENQMVLFSTNRNRSLVGFGSGFRLTPTLVWGLKLDQPFMRHVVMPLDYPGRFQGQKLDLQTRRGEFQLGWAFRPDLAFGASLGLTQVKYAWDNMVRTTVDNPSTSSPLGLMESDLRQSGARTVPSYSLGFRWAVNSRWTFGGTYVGPIRANLSMSAGYGSAPATFYNLSGYGAAPVGTSTLGAAQQAATSVQAGGGTLVLPGKAVLGVRQRVNQVFTWEMDMAFIQGAQTRLPGDPSASYGSASVSGPGGTNRFRNGYGINLMGELTLSKRWTARIGAELETALRQDEYVDPVLGGSKTSGLSAGFGFKMLGGELNVGYQYRQSQDADTPNLNGAWSHNSGYYTVPASTTRVEGMGHLWAVGFKEIF
jgi:long-subunit fatty acid transport protein